MGYQSPSFHLLIHNPESGVSCFIFSPRNWISGNPLIFISQEGPRTFIVMGKEARTPVHVVSGKGAGAFHLGPLGHSQVTWESQALIFQLQTAKGRLP